MPETNVSKPNVTAITVSVRRVVQRRQFEPEEFTFSATAEPNPDISVADNFDMLRRMLVRRLDAAFEEAQGCS